MKVSELAKQAGFSDADDKGVWITDGYWDKELKAFAALVAAHERADERGRMCKQCKECLNEKSTSNEANRPAFLGEGGQAN